MKTLLTLEIKEKRENDLRNVINLVREGINQKICSKYKECKYVLENIEAVNLTIPQANGYMTLICEKYPDACELNIMERK